MTKLLRSSIRISFLFKYLNLLILPNYVFITTLLRSVRVVFLGNFSDYSGLTPRIALNQLFYRVQSINIAKFSRAGVSTLVGGGSYKLSNWWHLPILSVSVFAHAQAVTVLWGASLIMMWLFYFDFTTNGIILFSVLPMLSTAFYFNVINYQNYNIIGLLVVSPILYFLLTGNTLLFIVLAIMLPLLSITTFVILTPFVFLSSVLNLEMHWIAIFCACAPIVVAPLGFTKKTDFADNLSWVINAMGIKTSKYKLKRASLGFQINLRDWYLIYSYSLASVCLIYVQSDYTYQFLSFPLMHFLNRKVFKFSDDENISAVFTITFITLLILSEKNDINALLLACLALFEPSRNIDRLKLIDTSGMISKLQLFLGTDTSEPILLCFPNPQNNYDDCFSGQRILIEPTSYACNKNEKLMIPDWWAVFNQPNLPNFWINSKDDLIAASKSFGINEFVSTSAQNNALFDEDFVYVGSFDWDEIYFQEFDRDLSNDFRIKHPVMWNRYRLRNEN